MVDYSKVQINLISKDTLDRMTTAEKLTFIINEVKQGKVLILEQGLDPSEQFELNKLTMSEIDHESFIGIEMPGFSADFKKPSFFDRLFRRRKGPRMMAIGPAKLMTIIKKEPSFIQTMITPGISSSAESSTGEGIPLEYNQQKTAPAALPIDDDENEEKMAENQARLEEFDSSQSNEAAGFENREKLEMLIGPELREDPQGPAQQPTGTEQPPAEQVNESTPEVAPAASAEEEITPEPEDRPIEAPPTETVQDTGSPYLLRKLKDESEEE